MKDVRIHSAPLQLQKHVLVVVLHGVLGCSPADYQDLVAVGLLDLPIRFRVVGGVRTVGGVVHILVLLDLLIRGGRKAAFRLR